MFFVLGSGPASVSCAVALAQRGIPVTILDAGRTLEPERAARVARMGAQEAAQWSEADLHAIRAGDKSAREGSVHVKLTYGSDYPYSEPGHTLREPGVPIDFHYSRARGGLSNVWGASLLPNRASDIRDWPLSLEELEPHYRAVHRFLPSSSVRDELDARLPIYTERGEAWESSRQIAGFLADLKKHRARLERGGLYYGRSRMAVRVGGDAHRHACNYCGLCLYGCPYTLIYSSAQTLDDLLAAGKVTYVPDQIVERLEQTPGGTVRIHTRSRLDSQPGVYEASRVFAGCGILPTAYIVLNSLGHYNTPHPMLDSQYFIYPFFRFGKTQGVESEALHSLAQAFLEIDAPWVSERLVHLEVFSYSDFLRQALMETPLRWLLRHGRLREELLGRLLVLQGFLHSDDSARMEVELIRESAQARPVLAVRPRKNAHSLWTSLKAGLKLSSHALSLRGLPVIPAIQFADPGRSYHSGGSFPMRREPGALECDTLGRLPGWDRVHLIDASVFPSIPATSITLTVMANAHRIGTEAPEG